MLNPTRILAGDTQVEAMGVVSKDGLCQILLNLTIKEVKHLSVIALWPEGTAGIDP